MLTKKEGLMQIIKDFYAADVKNPCTSGKIRQNRTFFMAISAVEDFRVTSI